jgi:hypothetical protein
VLRILYLSVLYSLVCFSFLTLYPVSLYFVVHSGKIYALFCKLLFYIILDVNIVFLSIKVTQRKLTVVPVL